MSLLRWLFRAEGKADDLPRLHPPREIRSFYFCGCEVVHLPSIGYSSNDAHPTYIIDRKGPSPIRRHVCTVKNQFMDVRLERVSVTDGMTAALRRVSEEVGCRKAPIAVQGRDPGSAGGSDPKPVNDRSGSSSNDVLRQTSDCLEASIGAAVRSLVEARAAVERWREREARCCPEDVSFEEHILALNRLLSRAGAVLRAIRRDPGSVLPSNLIPEAEAVQCEIERRNQWAGRG